MAEAVAERGYANAAVADVIAGAGVSRRTFYELFPNKERCFLASYDRGVGMVLDAIAAAVDAAPNPYAAAALGTQAYLGVLAAHPALARAFFVEVLAAGQRAAARRDGVLERFTDNLVSIYADAAGALAVLPPAPPRYVFQAAVDAVNELVTRELVRSGPAALPALADQVLDIQMRLLVGHELATQLRASLG